MNCCFHFFLRAVVRYLFLRNLSKRAPKDLSWYGTERNDDCGRVRPVSDETWRRRMVRRRDEGLRADSCCDREGLDEDTGHFVVWFRVSVCARDCNCCVCRPNRRIREMPLLGLVRIANASACVRGIVRLQISL